MRSIFLISLVLLTSITTNSCKRKGCRSDVPCVENYDPKAKKDGDCLGCMTYGAYNYCTEATEPSGNCLFIREFYSEYGTDGYIDVWVSDSTDNTSLASMSYEGRIAAFPSAIPDCAASDSTLTVLRRQGEYYYEIETQTGVRDWGWVIFREEGCRLLDVY